MQLSGDDRAAIQDLVSRYNMAHDTDDVEGWFEYMRGREGFELRTEELTDESGRVSVFVGYDPEGYFLEWDTFLDVEGNEELLELLGAR